MRKIHWLAVLFLLLVVPVAAQERTIVIRAGLLLDGQGGAVRNRSIVIQGRQLTICGR